MVFSTLLAPGTHSILATLRVYEETLPAKGFDRKKLIVV